MICDGEKGVRPAQFALKRPSCYTPYSLKLSLMQKKCSYD